MKILVTGAAGRVGSKLVDKLILDGNTVIGYDIRSTNRGHTAYSEVLASFADVAVVRKEMAGIDAVIHLGAFMSWAPADSNAMFETNVIGTRILLDQAASNGVKTFVFASTGEVYPENAPAYLPIDESHPLKPTTQYGITKLLGEEMVRFYERATAMNTVILRFSHTQDATELLDRNSFFSGPRFFLTEKVKQQRSLGSESVARLLEAASTANNELLLMRNQDGRPYRMHITDTRDMVEGILLALRCPEAQGEVFNVGATNPVDFSVALSRMSELTGLPLVTVDLPGPGVFYETSNQKIREMLGFAPAWTFDKMLDEAFAHYRDQVTVGHVDG